MVNRCRVATVLGLLAVLAGPARAQDASLTDARQRFEEGQDLYARGDYSAAAAAFLAAHDARPYPAFLFNAAVCFEKLGDYPRAVELFARYLAADPDAADRAEVKRRLETLEAELERSKPKEPPPAGDTPPRPDTATPPTPPTPPPAVEALPAVKPKGLVVVESKPAGAAIYLDDKKKGLLGRTPWNGSLDDQHTLIVEAKGFKTERKTVAPTSDKLLWIYMSLSEEHYLGWLEVRANVPGADVFIDRREVGAVGRTPFMGNVQPGRHKVIVTREGYGDVERTIEIERGKAQQLEVELEPSPIGFVRVRGQTVDGARVMLDGKQVCQTAPCRFEAPQGAHSLTIERDGKKPYGRTLDVRRSTETTLEVKLAPKPSRTDAIWQFLFAAGFGTGAYFLWDYADGRPEDQERKVLTYTAYGVGTIGVLAGVTGVWYLVRDKGPPSTGTAESRPLAIVPAIGRDVAGVAASWRW